MFSCDDKSTPWRYAGGSLALVTRLQASLSDDCSAIFRQMALAFRRLNGCFLNMFPNDYNIYHLLRCWPPLGLGIFRCRESACLFPGTVKIR